MSCNFPDMRLENCLDPCLCLKTRQCNIKTLVMKFVRQVFFLVEISLQQNPNSRQPSIIKHKQATMKTQESKISETPRISSTNSTCQGEK
jgi:hypothetical protein